MIFFVIMGGLFTLYALDLLLLVVVSAIARAKEVVQLSHRNNKDLPPHIYDAFKRPKRPEPKAKKGKKGKKGSTTTTKGSTPVAAGTKGLMGSKTPLTSLKLIAPAGPEEEPAPGHTGIHIGHTMGESGHPPTLAIARQVSNGANSQFSCPSTPLPPAPEPHMTLSGSRGGGDDTSSGSVSVAGDMASKVARSPRRASAPAPGTSSVIDAAAAAAAETAQAQPGAVIVNPLMHDQVVASRGASSHGGASPAPALPLQPTRSAASSLHSEVTPAEDEEEAGLRPTSAPLGPPHAVSGSHGDLSAMQHGTAHIRTGSMGAPAFGGTLQHAVSDASVLSAGASCSSVGSYGAARVGGGHLQSAGGSLASSYGTSLGSALSADIVIAAELVQAGGKAVKKGSSLSGSGAQLSMSESETEEGGEGVWGDGEWPRPAHEYPLVLIQVSSKLVK